MEKTLVVFRTIVGRVPIKSDVDFNMSEEFLRGDKEAWRDGVQALVLIPREDAMRSGKQAYKLDFSIAVIDDIDTLRKQNEMYAAQEDNGRHHVALDSLKLHEIWIDGHFLRIEWLFVDCFGIKRVFAGNQYSIHKSHTQGDDVFCTMGEQTLQVYF